MHQPIRDNLEEYLKGSTGEISQEFQAHLQGCQECASELRLFRGQAEMLRSLRADLDLEPRAGFYGRVIDRIDQDGRTSMWSILLQPNFGRRLAVASAVLVMLLGTYLVTAESSEPEIAANEIVFDGAPSTPAAEQDGLQQQRQRDAVLVNLAAYHE